MKLQYINISSYNNSGHSQFDLNSKWTTEKNVKKLASIASKYFTPDKITINEIKEFDETCIDERPQHFRLDDYTPDDLIEFENILSNKHY